LRVFLDPYDFNREHSNQKLRIENQFMKKKILIVDDDPGILTMLKLMLRLEGYNSVVCEDPGQIFDVLNAESPDLVLLDAMMPTVDGLTVLRQIQERKLQRTPPIILFTGKVDEKYIRCALEAGASGHLTKPFVKEELLERLNEFLSK
jgi:two-component system alkaline phosphatase synthesis response regulator PhoP